VTCARGGWGHDAHTCTCTTRRGSTCAVACAGASTGGCCAHTHAHTRVVHTRYMRAHAPS
jgi:hypothetical protein